MFLPRWLYEKLWCRPRRCIQLIENFTVSVECGAVTAYTGDFAAGGICACVCAAHLICVRLGTTIESFTAAFVPRAPRT